MKNVLTILLLLCGVCYAEDPPKTPEVFPAEVHRRGDEVRVVGEGHRGDVDDMKAEALEPPADDSAMWYVTVWTTPNCVYCEKLKADFTQKPELNGYILATPPQLAWAHFNVYNASDETQKWRKDAYKVTSYPTIVVQPPRNKKFGDPKVVVFYQKGYDGNAAKLRDSIKSAVYRYAEKLVKDGLVPESFDGHGQVDLKGTNPPFAVNPFQPNPQPAPQYPTYDPNQQYPPPQPQPQQQSPVPSTQTVTMLLCLVYFAWDVIRQVLKMRGVPILIPDAQKTQIQDWITQTVQRALHPPK